jgi:isoleucyl-tRNA synthetase
MDCWLESGAMPYATVGRVGIVELLEKHCTKPDSGLKFDSENKPYIQTDNYIHDDNQIKPIRERFSILPADFIAEGLDQTRGWFYTLLVLSASLFDMIPFKNVIVNGLVLAEDGKKMSKRLKNYPDPMEIVNEYGSDALRLYLLGSQATKAEAIKFTKSGVHDTMKDILIPLTNSIVFWKEYMNLYLKTHKTNPIFSLNVNKSKITNPINLWVIRQYSELRTEFAPMDG